MLARLMPSETLRSQRKWSKPSARSSSATSETWLESCKGKTGGQSCPASMAASLHHSARSASALLCDLHARHAGVRTMACSEMPVVEQSKLASVTKSFIASVIFLSMPPSVIRA